MSSESKKMYRVDWTYEDEMDGSTGHDYTYLAASSHIEAIHGIVGTDFKVREASKEEMEAYVAGYEDGYDIAIITERFKDGYDLENIYVPDDLSELLKDLNTDETEGNE